jgi:hypothetical protein
VIAARLRLPRVRETMFPSRAPFFKDRLSARSVATAAANAEDRDVACDVAEEAVPALPAWPLPKRGNLPVSPYAPSPDHRPKVGR